MFDVRKVPAPLQSLTSILVCTFVFDDDANKVGGPAKRRSTRVMFWNGTESTYDPCEVARGKEVNRGKK